MSPRKRDAPLTFPFETMDQKATRHAKLRELDEFLSAVETVLMTVPMYDDVPAILRLPLRVSRQITEYGISIKGTLHTLHESITFEQDRYMLKAVEQGTAHHRFMPRIRGLV